MKKILATLLMTLSPFFLSGCAQDEEQSQSEGTYSVNGDFGAPPTLTADGAIAPVTSVVSETLIQGNGLPIVENGPILLRATSFDSRTGDVLSDYDTGKIRMTTANKDGVGDIAEFLIGQSEGTRMVIQRPGLLNEKKDASEIIVVDILHTMTTGEPAPPPATVPAGMPEVTVLDSGAPHITKGGGSIPQLAIVPITLGNGGQLAPDDVAIIQYLITDTNGNIIDTTWNGVGPVTVPLNGDLMKGLRDGLVDQKVGSRVVILVPSSQATGEGDRIVVVDILALGDK